MTTGQHTISENHHRRRKRSGDLEKILLLLAGLLGTLSVIVWILLPQPVKMSTAELSEKDQLPVFPRNLLLAESEGDLVIVFLGYSRQEKEYAIYMTRVPAEKIPEEKWAILGKFKPQRIYPTALVPVKERSGPRN